MDDGFRMGRRREYIHAVPHIEYFKHFTVTCTRSLLDKLKNNWRIKEIIFDHFKVPWKIFHTLGLSTPTAMN